MPWVASLTPERQREAVRLYESGLSAQQTADQLGTSLDAVFYALRKLKVPRRSIHESNRIRFERSPLSYSLKAELTDKEERLKIAAVMLYWAEGYKIGATIDFANSDPEMAALFMQFLVRICGVNRARVRCHLYCYEGQDVDSLTAFWSKLLDVPQSQFIKPYINRKLQPGPRGPRMIHGLIHICYCDKRLLTQILNWIAEYSQECVGGGAVNRTGL
ncbi:MAG: hypothetical protein KBC38_03705 [Candidatus Pacebacteria bacterium]|nr:hypothetical protein [Candidatus Paceibacterota bacterium]MBP9840533.1 hypothetical protein [Candidatus Paceibacterota bacterium]